VRFADLILRQGHLSERAVVDAVMSGNRPAHLDRCDVCASRAVDLARWLDDTRTLGVESADAVFSAELLTAQRAQILRKLEQLDEPARVISFPRYAARADEAPVGRRVAASWVAVAAAAGLIVGVVGGQISARLTAPAPQTADAVNADVQPVDTSDRPVDTSYLQHDYDDRLTLRSLELLDEITPKLVQTAARRGR
jgi:hypothetical protein